MLHLEVPLTLSCFLTFSNSYNLFHNVGILYCNVPVVFLAAYCISVNTIAVSLICIWTGAMFWSAAPLLGWGNYTGLFSHTITMEETRIQLLKALGCDLGVLFFLDRGYGTCEVDWAKANYSTIHKSYIISILIFCFFIPVMIMLFCYTSIINTVKNTNAMTADGFLTSRQRKVERDVTRVRGKQVDICILLEGIDSKSKIRLFKELFKKALSVIQLLSRYTYNYSLMFLSRFPL